MSNLRISRGGTLRWTYAGGNAPRCVFVELIAKTPRDEATARFTVDGTEPTPSSGQVAFAGVPCPLDVTAQEIRVLAPDGHAVRVSGLKEPAARAVSTGGVLRFPTRTGDSYRMCVELVGDEANAARVKWDGSDPTPYDGAVAVAGVPFAIPCPVAEVRVWAPPGCTVIAYGKPWEAAQMPGREAR